MNGLVLEFCSGTQRLFSLLFKEQSGNYDTLNKNYDIYFKQETWTEMVAFPQRVRNKNENKSIESKFSWKVNRNYQFFFYNWQHSRNDTLW